MKEQDLADVVCCSERKVRDLRETYLREGVHWERREGHVWYLDPGIHEMEAALGLEVGTVSKTLAGMVAEGVLAENAPGCPKEPLEGAETKAGAVEGQDGAVAAAVDGDKMVMAVILRRLPNARVYVAQVVGTRRILRLKTKARMGLARGRKLWCVDLGEELVFDRMKARMRRMGEMPNGDCRLPIGGREGRGLPSPALGLPGSEKGKMACLRAPGK